MRMSMLALAVLGCLICVAAEVGGQVGGTNPFGRGGGGFGSTNFGPMAPTSVKPSTWEYRVLTDTSITNEGKDKLEAGLNGLGADGWELIAIDSKTNSRSYIFRRPGAKKPRTDPKPTAESAPKEKADARPEIGVYRLRHASAAEVGRIIEELMRSGRQDSLRVVADPHTNQLLMRGPAQVQREAEAILMRLDVPNDSAPPGPSKKEGAFPAKR